AHSTCWLLVAGCWGLGAGGWLAAPKLALGGERRRARDECGRLERVKKKVKNKTAPSTDISRKFAQVVEALSREPHVTAAVGKGFGSGAIKGTGKIFAMISSKDEFVVKLSKERVDELVDAGRGERFDTGGGRKMKEWLAVGRKRADWISLAEEAY